jgi:hypothetical protein
MVAKSYQNLETVGDVYMSRGRRYIQVRTNNGVLKQVRWYSDREYAKMYPEDVSNADENHPAFKTQKEVLGFEKGYITIFKGNTFEDKEYFKLNSARYARMWGWYFISTEDLPNDIPEDVEPIRLNWEDVGHEDGTLKSEKEIAAVVEALIYNADESEYQGAVGEKVDVWLTVEKAIALDGYYGPSTMHVMRDDCGNCFVWTTAAKSWSEGSEHHIAGTIKDLRTYKGTKQTILTRCRELS